MICRLSSARRPTPRSQSAWTVMEFMVGTGVGSLIMIAVAQITLFTARSFVAMGNYADLDRASRNTLDVMSRDIRGAKSVGYYATNQLVLTNMDGTLFSYTYQPSDGTVIRQWGSSSNTVLTGCDYFYFRVWQRNPTNYFWFPYPTSNNPYMTKLVDVSWKCSRKILDAKVNTESVQTAKITIRN